MVEMARARFFAWTPDDAPAVIIPTDTDEGYARLRKDYTPVANVPETASPGSVTLITIVVSSSGGISSVLSPG